MPPKFKSKESSRHLKTQKVNSEGSVCKVVEEPGSKKRRPAEVAGRACDNLANATYILQSLDGGNEVTRT